MPDNEEQAATCSHESEPWPQMCFLLVSVETVDACINRDMSMDAVDYEAESWSLTVEHKFCKTQDKRAVKRQDVIYGEQIANRSCHMLLYASNCLRACCRADADGASPPADFTHHGRGFPTGDEGGGAAGLGGSGAGLPLSGPAAGLPSRLLRRNEGAATQLGPAAGTRELPHSTDRRRPAPTGSQWFLLE